MGTVRRVSSELRRTVTVLGMDLPLFGFATILDQGGRLVLNLVAAAILGPVVFGTWVILNLFLQYAVFLGLGIPNGAGREIPRLLGAGDASGAAATEDVASLGIVVTGLGAAVVAVLVAPAVTGVLDPATLGLLALAVVLQHAFLLQQVLFRSRLRFRPASLQLATQGIAAPVVGIVLLAAGWGIAGLLLARVAVVMVALAMAGRTLVRIPRPRIDQRRLAAIIRIGLPLLAAGVLLALLVTVDRWIVLAILGQEAVGIYGLVGIASASLILVPTMISQQYYPRLAFARGAGADGPQLLRMARDQGLLAGALTAAAATLVGGVAWFTIPAFLPAYEAAVVPILVILVGMAAYAGGSAHGNLLSLVGRQRRYLAIQGSVLVGDIALCIGLISAGLGLMGAALASAVSMATYAALLYRSTADLRTPSTEPADIESLPMDATDVHPPA